MFSAIVTFVGSALLLGAIYDWRWLWRVRSFGPWLDARLGHTNARRIIGLVGALLIYWQLRQAVDGFTGSFIGQVLFWGGAAGLLALAYAARRRDS